jgi:hypothetical protein
MKIFRISRLIRENNFQRNILFLLFRNKITLQYNFIHLLVNSHKQKTSTLSINKEYFGNKSYRFVWLDVLHPSLLRREDCMLVEKDGYCFMECNAILFGTKVPTDRRERRVGQLRAKCHSVIPQDT